MNTTIWFFLFCLGALGHTFFYRPIKHINSWVWSVSWLMQGIFAWLIIPLLVIMISLPSGQNIFELYNVDSEVLLRTFLLGIGWGVGVLIFASSLRFIGIDIVQSIALGTSSVVGTLLPVILKGEDLFSGRGLMLLVAVSVGIVGVVFIVYAFRTKEISLKNSNAKSSVKNFTFSEGLFLAILAGVMIALFKIGLDTAKPIEEMSLSRGYDPRLAGLPSILIITAGGFLVNFLYCLQRIFKKKSVKEFYSIPLNVFFKNILLAFLAGSLWYLQFFSFVIGKSYLGSTTLLFAYAWSALMMLNIFLDLIYSLMRKKWKGSSVATMVLLVMGLLILIVSAVLPMFFNQ